MYIKKRFEAKKNVAKDVIADNAFGKIVKTSQQGNVLAFFPIDDDGKNDDCTYFFTMFHDRIIPKGWHWGRDEIDHSMIAPDGTPWIAEPDRPTHDWVHTKKYATQLADRVRKCLEAGITNKDDAAEEVFNQRKSDTIQRIEHLSGIVGSFQPTERAADQTKISLMDYILKGLDTLIGDVEDKLGLR